MESQVNLAPKKPKKSKKQSNKVRVKLPGIESFEKELEFPAEGPGRVIVRLERLMGSDKIRITDPKYLSTLVERLEAEEAQAWTTRSRLRKKAEKNRSRQLAIEGLMEPAEDMQDLWNHPVFRVNRILNRLNVFDHNMSVMGGDLDKLPGITEVEPFIGDESGAVFKTFPGHNIFYHQELPFSASSHVNVSDRKSQIHRKVTTTEIMKPSADKDKAVSAAATPTASAAVSKVSLGEGKKEDEDGDEEEEDDEEEEEEEEMLPKVKTREQLDLEAKVSLEDFRQLYGVPSDENLVGHWSPFRSDLVNMVYKDDGSRTADTLYEMSDQVAGVYCRQQLTVDDYVAEHTPDAVLAAAESQEVLLDDEEEETEEEEEDEEESYFGEGEEEGQNEDDEEGGDNAEAEGDEKAEELEEPKAEEAEEDKDEEADQEE